MKSLESQISDQSKNFFQALSSVKNETDLEHVRITFLSRQGIIAQLMQTLSTCSLEEKRLLGPQLNAFKQKAHTAFEEKKQTLAQQKIAQGLASTSLFDVTAYDPYYQAGTLHPLTILIQQIEDIFISMSFERIDGPEVETDFYNFEALNIPADHPARDMHDTFWLTLPHYLLRTHTSTMQIHAAQERRPPFALFAPGRVYRHEATDATHEYNFMQCEGLFVDKNVSLAHLLATLKTFLQKLFEKKDIGLRARPSYFPFVEPGLEIDISCPFCTQGCSICKKTGWVEICGGGLVHPHVLRASHIDPAIYSGFAFGFGIERLAMLKFGINDIRLFRANKLEFLRQF